MSFTIKSTRTAMSAAAVALALAGSVAAAAPAGAAAPTVKIVAPHTDSRVSPHNSSCDSVGSNTFSWWGNCRVTSGTARAAAACADGLVHYGSWVGVGYWRFGMNCYPYAMESFWVENGG